MKEKDFQQLNIVFTNNNRVWSFCPYHKDTIRPNLSISLLERYYGRWKCWACGRDGVLSPRQMKILNLESLTPYKNDSAKLSTMWKQFTKTCYDNLQRLPLLKLGLAKELNVSIKSLNAWKVGYDGMGFTVPMFREDLGEYSSQGYNCGVQHRFSDGTKRCITGSCLGLMYPYDLIGDYYIFICEGFSDGISVWDLGLQSIARPHCWYTDGMEYFLGKTLEGIENIIIIPDNDTVGMEGAMQLQNKLNGLTYFDADGWELYMGINIFPLDGAKDIRQLIQLRGKDYVKRELEKYI